MEEEKQNQNEQKNPENEEEYTCPVCLELLFEPMTTPCNHSFCELCIEEMYEIQDKAICPLDRKQLKQSQFIKIPQLRLKIEQNFPEKYQQRLQYYNQQKQIRNALKKITILYGNFHELLVANPNSQNSHRWTVFTEIENDDTSKYIKEVSYTLHETFNPMINVIRQSPFQHTRIGWGTFEIPIKIKFKGNIYKNSDTLEISHHLVFRNQGKTNKIVIKIDTNKLQQQQQQQQYH